MDLLIAFGLFLAVLVTGLILDLSTLIAMAAGLLCFTAVGLKRGFHFADLLRMAVKGGRKSIGILKVFVLIGLITGLWRCGGVIAYFVYYGLQIITPSFFLIIAFFLSCILSYALGTSFGVIGTVGVVLMAIGRSGGVNPLLVGGVILSASYFGDRSSPTSSFLNLATLLTKTRLMDNVKALFRTGALPLLLTAMIYLALSLRNPLTVVDSTLPGELSQAFSFTPWLLLPAALMIVLPLLKVDVLYAMAASVTASFILALATQDIGLMDTLRVCLFGYQPAVGAIASIFSGGGLLSMVNVSGIVLISSCYSGIFEGTRMLEHVQDRMTAMSRKIGRFPANVIVGVASACVFCSQTLAALLSHQLLENTYDAQSNTEHLLDLCNSTGVLSAMVPWCLACAVPMQMLDVGPGVLPWACYLYLTPLCYGLVKWMRGRRRQTPGQAKRAS